MNLSHFSLKPQGAFTLVELLAVLAVIAVLAAVSIPAIRTLVKSDSLNAETAVVSNMLTMARTEAISLRTPVQLRIVTNNWQNGGAANNTSLCYRMISLWQLEQTDPNPADPNYSSWNPKTWAPLTPWQFIGPHIIFENTPDPTTPTTLYGFTTSNSPVNNGCTNFLSTAYVGTTLTTSNAQFSGSAGGNVTANMVALEFLPTGQLNTGSVNTYNIYVLLTEGSYNGTSISYTEPQTPLHNWAQIQISNLTGTISVVRP